MKERTSGNDVIKSSFDAKISDILARLETKAEREEVEDGGAVRQVDRTAGPVCADFQPGGREHQGKDDCRMLEFLKLEFKIHPM